MNELTDVSRCHAQQLADRLVKDGLLDGRRAEAFAATPRELFLPAFYQRVREGWSLITPETVGENRWRDLAYQDVTWVQRLDGPDHPGGTPAASCLRPSLAAQILRVLPDDADTRVCEIGAGTGWITALLSHYYGPDHVIAIELDHHLVDQARDALARLDFRPTLITTDGYLAHADRAPYDVILSTAAITQIPEHWITQTRPGGTIVTPFRGGVAILRTGRDHRIVGRFLPEPVAILPLRSPRTTAVTSAPSSAGLGRPARTVSTTPPLRDPNFRFVLGLLHPELTVTDHGLMADLTVTDPTGAIVRVTTLSTAHTDSGPDLWKLLHSIWELWDEAGQPGPASIELELIDDTWWTSTRLRSTAPRWRL